MTNVINANCAVLIKGIEDIWTEDFDKRLDIDIDIVKDLDKEPNEATVTIYNINEDTIAQILDMPIEIYFTPFGSTDLVRCYTGEITSQSSSLDMPGVSLKLNCSSNDWQYKAKYIDKKTYIGSESGKGETPGTSYTEIINDFVAEIGLPSRIYDIPDGRIYLAQSFQGPAFQLLDRFVRDLGMFCHIIDGVLCISSVYDPAEPTVINITEAMMETRPREMQRTAADDVLMKTIVDTRGTGLQKIRAGKYSRQKWEKRVKKKDKNDDYVEYEVVDTILSGMECRTLGVPGIDPDNIVQFEGDDNKYRVSSVHHFGSNNGEGFTTVIRADLIDGLSNGVGFSTDTKTAAELKAGVL